MYPPDLLWDEHLVNLLNKLIQLMDHAAHDTVQNSQVSSAP